MTERDRILEDLITEARLEVSSCESLAARRLVWQALRWLVGRRSQARVAEMERERGLA
jgi:hypothetical protein